MRRATLIRLIAAPAACLVMWTSLGACSSSTPEPTAKPAPSAQPTATAVATAEPEATASAEPPPEQLEPLPNTGERLTPSGIKKIVRASFSEMQKCFEAGLERDPSLNGRVDIMLAIADDGLVMSAGARPPSAAKKPKPRMAPKPDSDDTPPLTDPEVVGCLERHFKRLRFPPTNRGIMNLIYPVVFSVE